MNVEDQIIHFMIYGSITSERYCIIEKVTGQDWYWDLYYNNGDHWYFSCQFYSKINCLNIICHDGHHPGEMRLIEGFEPPRNRFDEISIFALKVLRGDPMACDGVRDILKC